MPKYSIVLPTYNSAQYLKACIDSVLMQEYQDFEFIVSNNHSTDETESVLQKYNDKRLKVIKPKEYLKQLDHWGFAISKAEGEWIIGLGTDDALLPYFFYALDKIISFAEKKNINIIKANRVYYFYPGMEQRYKDNFVNYRISSGYEIYSTRKSFLDVFEDANSFYDMPQMYSTCLFRKCVMDNIKKVSKRDYLFPANAFGQDACLGIFACIFEKKFLKINIPIGWVGSSPSSFGYNDGLAREFDNIVFGVSNSYRTINSTIHLVYHDLGKILNEIDKRYVPFYMKRILKRKYWIYKQVYKQKFLGSFSSSDEYIYRLEAFKAYCKYEKIDFKKLTITILFEKKIKKIFDFFFYKIFHLNKIILIFFKVKRCLFLKEPQIYDFSINLKQTDYMSYADINKIIIQNSSVNYIIESVSRW